MAGIWKCRCGRRAPGLRVLELPVAYRRRIGGESKVAGSLRGSLRAGLKIISTFVRVARSRCDSALLEQIASI